MNTGLLMRGVVAQVARAPVRTLIMMLGVLVSVCATILLLTIGSGLKHSFSTFIERNYPPYAVHVMAFAPGALDLKDVAALMNGMDDARLADPTVYLYSKGVKGGAGTLQVNVEGHSEHIGEFSRRGALEGSFFDSVDVRRKAHVALLGPETAKALFPNDSPIGQTIFIDNMSLEVKGVLEPRGADPHGISRDQFVYMPYTVAMEQLAKVSYVSAATVILNDGADMAHASAQATKIMRAQHNRKEGEQDDFGVSSPLALQGEVGRIFLVIDSFVSLLAIVAYALSALVIWIIMNVSLRERTAEVGLRKSLGARSADLRVQFLLEIMAVTTIGCVSGWMIAILLLRTVAPPILGRYGLSELDPGTTTILLCIVLAAIAGTVGGWWPIKRAASLHPIQALR